jgi:pimeloyl-ACP methyl ester carboxylesterase/predicted amino acid-binding ACT domain protein
LSTQNAAVSGTTPRHDLSNDGGVGDDAADETSAGETATDEAGTAAGHLQWAQVEVQGRPAAYGEAGAGAPVVFLHGWGLGHHAYKRSLKRLAVRGHHVLAPALPGFGGTADLPGPERSITGYAVWVDDFMTAVGIDEPAIVIGHSFGGGVAIRFAAESPGRVRQLVLVNSVGGAVSGGGSALRRLADRPVWEWGVHLARELLPFPQGLRAAATMGEDLIPNLVRNPRAFWDVGGLARRADLRSELAALASRHLPVLVVSGEHDTVIPLAAFEAMCEVLGTAGTVVPGNHTWLLADPDAFDAALADVTRLDSGGPRPVAGSASPRTVELRTLLAGTSLPADLADDLIATAPPLWLASDAVGDLAGDLVLCHPPLGPDEIRARVSISPNRTWRLTVVAHDRPGLLAGTAAVLASDGRSIRSASVATWDHLDVALHSVTVTGRPPPAGALDAIGAHLRAVAAGAEPEIWFVPKGVAAVRQSGEANGDPILTVTAVDQTGLLWAICRCLADQGVGIQSAWIAGDRMAHDTLIVRGTPDLVALQDRLSRAGATTGSNACGRALARGTAAGRNFAKMVISATRRDEAHR